jgi:hypothetical protein
MSTRCDVSMNQAGGILENQSQPLPEEVTGSGVSRYIGIVRGGMRALIAVGSSMKQVLLKTADLVDKVVCSFIQIASTVNELLCAIDAWNRWTITHDSLHNCSLKDEVRIALKLLSLSCSKL